jgi:hypothetical protein
MGDVERKDLISKLQAARGGRLLVSYITSTRPGLEIQIADDMLRRLFDHLEADREAAKKGVDLFIHSNGGQSTVPWRIVSLIREYTDNFAVLVPHHAFSAGTLIALGADEIVMHRMGCLGPIDPSVANIFNPQNPYQPGQPAPISVEDVSAYFKLVKEDVGINHEDELIQAFAPLANQIHPLALGNVQRHHQQSRLMAKKLLLTHMGKPGQPDKDHDIETIIDHLKSKLFFHGHPINRREAREDLKLAVKDAPAEVEDLMWALYLQYEDVLQMATPFSFSHELDQAAASAAAAGPPAEDHPADPPVAAPPAEAPPADPPAAAPPAGPPVAAPPVNPPAATPVLPPGGIPPHVLQMMHQAQMMQQAAAQPAKVELDLPGAFVESAKMTHIFKQNLTIQRVTLPSPAGPQEGFRHEMKWQRWEKVP